MNRLPILIPAPCALCGSASRNGICEGCREQFYNSFPDRCEQCGLRLAASESAQAVCGACLHAPPSFDATVAAVDYAPPTDQLVLGLKFGAQLAYAPLFADMLLSALRQRKIDLPHLLIAVPLGPRRLAERGFNQALEIARPIARSLNIRLETRLVLRTRDTAAQALLPPDERRSNISRAFTLSSKALNSVDGCHIGIVDDVMTTGETLNELAATLKRFGARRITNLVFARTLK